MTALVEQQAIQVQTEQSTVQGEVAQSTVQVQVTASPVLVKVEQSQVAAQVTPGGRVVVVESVELIPGPPGPQGPPGPPGQAVDSYGGFVFITDVTSPGNVGAKEYVSGTVPANSLLAFCAVDSDTVTIHFLAEGWLSYSPQVTADGVPCVDLALVTGRLFAGTVTVQVTESREVVLSSSTGHNATVQISRAGPGPQVLTATVDLPTGQSAAKAGDLLTVAGTADLTASQVRAVGGAVLASAWQPVVAGTFAFQTQAGSGSGSQAVSLEARNGFGTVGPAVALGSVALDQVQPSFGTLTVAYPSGQAAFKGTESGTVSCAVSGADGVAYSSPTGEFTVASPGLYATGKTVTCTHPGTYNDSTVNYRIVASRSANGAVAVKEAVIEVADCSPLVTVSQPWARLRSGGNDGSQAQDYLITATSSQKLAQAPDIAVGVAGTWLGGGWGAVTDRVYSRSLRIDDTQAKGSGAWAWAGAAPTNRAGLAATIAGTQVNGGFVSRILTLAGFASEATMQVAAVDYSKVAMTWSVKNLPNKRALGTTATPDPGSWCLSALARPSIVRILDTEATNASSQASTITISEAV